jgi:DNA mismatch endonuclease (patch repair protein)
VDTVSPIKRSWVMSRVKSQGSGAEKKVISALRKNCKKFATHVKSLPGCPDVAFREEKLAIFVNGCFWHWHGCGRSRMPASNRLYWSKKIAGNVSRDKRNRRELHCLGWRYLTIWECNIETGLRRCFRALP